MNKPLLTKTGVFGDSRGLFFPLSLENTHERKWLQSNISISKRGTFRGLHHQVGESAQAKQISVVKGSIIDFLVDLRYGSFEEAYFFRMVHGDQIYVPRGFAHGFLALEEETMIQYLVDNVYSPKTEISFDWKSNETVKEIILAEIGDESNLLLSPKDANGIKLSREYAETIDYTQI
jgi:dTDP-4-dehydrorhamnose 3,5-epimerase